VQQNARDLGRWVAATIGAVKGLSKEIMFYAELKTLAAASGRSALRLRAEESYSDDYGA
jgi:hypothetical protein